MVFWCGSCKASADAPQVEQLQQPVEAQETVLRLSAAPATKPKALVKPEDLSISVVPGDARIGRNEDLPVLVSLATPAGHSRTPVDICCVLDISNSMGDAVWIRGANGHCEGHGLSFLDIAMHGIRTTIQMLTENDRLAIVIFNTEAATILELTAMDAAGKKLVEEKLAHVTAKGGTRLWAGLHMGLEALRNGGASDSFAHLILLSDGASFYRKEIMPNLRAYKEKYERLPTGTINTVGIGYGIDSRLLVKLSNFGGGSYSFVPDAGFVGTVFVNALSNMLVTFAHDVYLCLEPEGGAEIKEVMGNHSVQYCSWGIRVCLGTLQYGQPRNVVVVVSTKSGANYLTASGQFEQPGLAQPVTIKAAHGQATHDQWEVELHKCRCSFVDLIVSCVDACTFDDEDIPDVLCVNSEASTETGSVTSVASAGVFSVGNGSVKTKPVLSTGHQLVPKATGAKHVGKSGKAWTWFEKMLGAWMQPRESNGVDKALVSSRQAIKTFKQLVEESLVADDERVKELLQDISGEATLALSNYQLWWLWGRHYLPSLMFAHQLQQCNNFKDSGVQRYGGKLFQQLREHAEEIFDQLPAPKPTGVNLPSFRGQMPQERAVTPISAISMAAYNTRFAGCIDGESMVRLASGDEIPVKNVVKGQQVLGPRGEVAMVLCSVRMPCSNGRATLVELPGGARLTPFHPVLFNEQWVFPKDLASTKEVPCEAVYNFVLSGAPSLLVGGLSCVALGHGIRDGAARHPYYGSPRAAQDVLKRPSRESGRVELHPEDVLRDSVTGMVCGLKDVGH